MTNLDSLAPKFLSLLRIVAGLLFLEHGTQKMFHFPPPLPAPPPAAVAAVAGAVHAAATHAPTLASILSKGAGPIEVIGGLLLLFGLFTRLAAFICSGEMAFAYFLAHFPKSQYPLLNGGGEAVLYTFIFLYLVFAGAGPISLDALLKKRA